MHSLHVSREFNEATDEIPRFFLLLFNAEERQKTFRRLCLSIAIASDTSFASNDEFS
jgi:hypothetical protein